MKYPCIESTLQFELKDIEYRLWVNEKEVKEIQDYDNIEIQNFIQEYIFENPTKTQDSLIQELHEKFPQINAIHIRNKSAISKGLVIYFIEFSEDIKG